MRRRDRFVLRTGPGPLEVPHPPHPVLGMYILPTVPTAGAIFKGAALRQRCVAETIWTVFVTEPR